MIVATDPGSVVHPDEVAVPSLHIGLIAPPVLPVPPPSYGGTELMIDQLARGLVARGCRVTLAAHSGSTCPVSRAEVPSCSDDDDSQLPAELRHAQAAYEALFALDVDVVHDHTALGPLWVGASPERPVCPVLATAHGPFTPELVSLFRRVAGRVGVVAISNAQRRTAGTAPVLDVVHHGIDVDLYPVGSGDGGYVLFLGRMSPVKGAHRAIAAARGAGRRILLAAKMQEAGERRYFHECVEPMLGPDAEYVGEVDFERKVDLLGGAEALLNPISWCEPFGLTMIESLACGTPVLSFPGGAAPEIVVDRVTGFLCPDTDGMVVALDRLDTIDRSKCREDAVRRFSQERMAAGYLDVYLRVLRNRDLTDVGTMPGGASSWTARAAAIGQLAPTPEAPTVERPRRVANGQP